LGRKKLTAYIFYSNITTIALVITLFLFNFKAITVIHAWASPSIPVFKYETYSSLETLSLYIISVLTSINILSMKVQKLSRTRHFTSVFTSIVSFIFILVTLINPHVIIINPTGLPPTQLDVLEIGGIISIVLYANLTINTITILWIERNC
jgi:hypothetical protein